MATEFVSSVVKENNSGYYRLHTRWLSDKLCVNIASKEGAWFGEITNEQLAELANGLKKSPDDYLRECKENLTCPDGKKDIVYAVDDGSFVWKQVIDEDTGIKVKLGAIPLKPANVIDTIQNMMDVALTTNKKLQEKILVLTQENEKKESSIDELFVKLETYQKNKDLMENDLFAKFLAILNAKKRKISQLEEDVIKANAILPAQKKKSNAKKVKLREKIVVDPYDEDTEDDLPGPSTRATTTRQNRVLSNQELPVTKKKRKAVSRLMEVDVPKNDSDATITDDELIQAAATTVTSAAQALFNCPAEDKCVPLNQSFSSKIVENNDLPPELVQPQISLSTKSKDLLDYFFGGQDSPETKSLTVDQPKSVALNPIATNSKTADIIDQFF